MVFFFVFDFVGSFWPGDLAMVMREKIVYFGFMNTLPTHFFRMLEFKIHFSSEFQTLILNSSLLFQRNLPSTEYSDCINFKSNSLNSKLTIIYRMSSVYFWNWEYCTSSSRLLRLRNSGFQNCTGCEWDTKSMVADEEEWNCASIA